MAISARSLQPRSTMNFISAIVIENVIIAQIDFTRTLNRTLGNIFLLEI